MAVPSATKYVHLSRNRHDRILIYIKTKANNSLYMYSHSQVTVSAVVTLDYTLCVHCTACQPVLCTGVCFILCTASLFMPVSV